MTAASRTIDDLLRDAAIAPVVTPAEIAASRRRVQERLTERQRVHAPQPDGDEARRRCPGGAGRPGDPCEPASTGPGQAAGSLRLLSLLVVRDVRAADSLAGLVNSARIEPDGALVFGCLLYLADRMEGAQFWWQFSAGAGRAAAALCLHLLHLRRADLRDARHWADQTTMLGQVSARQLRYLLRTRAALDGDPEPPAPHRGLTAAVRRLNTEDDQDFGPVPRPDPALAIRFGG